MTDDRKLRMFGQALVLAFFVIVGLGIYIYSLQTDLDATQQSITAVEQDRNGWKTKAEEAEGSIQTAKLSLNQCTAQVQELNSRIAASTPEPAQSRSRSRS